MASTRSVEEMRRRALVFWKLAQKSRLGGFSNLLGLEPEELGGSLRILKVGSRSSQIAVKVPSWCCETTSGRIYTSAALAMIDEISTYAGTAIWDRNCRPGVSIQLGLRALQPMDIGVGDELVVETRLVKLGKTIGFLDIELQNTKGDRLAVASHTKFLPMGMAFDLGLHPAIQDVSLNLFEKYLDRQPVQRSETPKDIGALFFSKGASSFVADTRHGNSIGSVHGGAMTIAGALAGQYAIENPSQPLEIQTNLFSGTRAHPKGLTLGLNTQVLENPAGRPITRTLISPANAPGGSASVESVVVW